MVITKGFGTAQLLITKGFGTSIVVEEIEVSRLGDRIVQVKQIGTPVIVGDRLSDRGRISSMEEAA